MASLHSEVCFLNTQTCFINFGFADNWICLFLLGECVGLNGVLKTNERISPRVRFGSKCAIQKAGPAGVCKGTSDPVGSWPC